ncbi:MAG: hypothetical protein DYH08_17000 [Actinobacteria bacterium ATB1]|nr:hypothetical protein [Actinobacteria bacterium ATB1]
MNPSRRRRSRGAQQDWLTWASRSRVPTFVKLARRIRRHRPAIERTLEWRISNGLVESTNTKCRLIHRRAFGFRRPRVPHLTRHARPRRLLPPTPTAMTHGVPGRAGILGFPPTPASPHPRGVQVLAGVRVATRVTCQQPCCLRRCDHHQREIALVAPTHQYA